MIHADVGDRVEGLYVGSVPVTGTVENWRLRYQDVIYYVLLDAPVKMRYRSVPVDRVILERAELTKVIAK